jgi:hypothetical protein
LVIPDEEEVMDGDDAEGEVSVEDAAQGWEERRGVGKSVGGVD